MICFTDKEVYSIYEDNVNRSELFSFFIKKENTNSVVIVYSLNEEYIGMVTYSSLLYSKDKTNVEIIKDKIYVSENMFREAGHIFSIHNKLDVLPIFNSNNELITFCFNSVLGAENIALENSLKEMENSKNELFIDEIYPDVEVVYIYGLNEWSYRIYKILVNRNFPVTVKGNKWKELFNIEEGEDLYPDFQRYNIMAEWVGNENNPIIIKNYFYENNFDILRKLSNINHFYEEIKWKKHFESLGIKFILFSGTFREEYSNYTANELFRISNDVFATNMEKNKNDKLIQRQYEIVSNMKYSEFKKIKESELAHKKYINLQVGKSVVKCDVYGEGDNTIFLVVPPCIANNLGNTYKDSLQNNLIQNINKKYSKEYKIISINVHDVDFGLFSNIMSKLKPTKKDVIITINRHFNKIFELGNLKENIDYDLRNLLANRDLDKEYFYDEPMHFNYISNKIVSDCLYKNFLENYIESVKDIKIEEKELFTDIEKQQLKKYLLSIEKYKKQGKNNGAIVMNCNPFTNGHLFLIEEASKKVDNLYIFVVQEDKSYFKFDDRIRLVKEGTSHISNVIVIPSGKFILSYLTLPSYFEKSKVQDEIIDASLDINIFGKYIAPFMDINKRFVGEEPIDKITKQYNNEMRKKLIYYNIDFEEIKRKEYKSNVISASRVRELIKENGIDEIKEMVPQSTYDFIVNNVHTLLTK